MGERRGEERAGRGGMDFRGLLIRRGERRQRWEGKRMGRKRIGKGCLFLSGGMATPLVECSNFYLYMYFK